MEDNLTCPICKEQMVKGNINRPAETFMFFPENIEPDYFRWRWTQTEGAILIHKFKLFEKKAFTKNAYMYPALYCPSCKKITIDL